jgi:hypothetical protein
LGHCAQRREREPSGLETLTELIPDSRQSHAGHQRRKQREGDGDRRIGGLIVERIKSYRQIDVQAGCGRNGNDFDRVPAVVLEHHGSLGSNFKGRDLRPAAKRHDLVSTIKAGETGDHIGETD